MTKQTIVAVFDDFSQARDAVSALESGGILHSDISIVANDADKRHSTQMGSDVGDRSDAGDDAKKGALAGGGIGAVAGLLAGIGMIAIPGIGPVVAAGTLVATLAGAGAGAAAGAGVGGLAGALSNSGVPEDDAHVYSV
jgi:hypothetical protein